MGTGHVAVVAGRGWRYELREPGGEVRSLVFERLDRESAGEVRLEPAVVGSMLRWMRSPASRLRVHGPLSRTLLRNLDELQTVWQCWRPEVYRRVEVVPDEVVDDTPAGQGAVAAFSGGVDASYTVFRHVVRPASAHLVELRECVMVQGFDIDLDEDDVFDRAVARAEKQLASTGLPLARVRTNAKRDLAVDWDDEFGLWVSAVLLTFAGDRRHGLLGSGETYEDPVPRVGSTPIQDWMASTGGFELRHDGAGRSRAGKLAELARWPEAVDQLRVCWRGEHHDRNCGRCEKCLRTMLSFLAVGLPVPGCFDDQLDLRRLRRLELRSPLLVSEFALIEQTARRHDVDGPWLRAVRALVRRHRRRPSLARRAWHRGRRLLARAR